MCNELHSLGGGIGAATSVFSITLVLLPGITGLGLFFHSHLVPFLLSFPVIDSTGWHPAPEDQIVSQWVCFFLSQSLAMMILKYLVAFVVPQDQILPLPLL